MVIRLKKTWRKIVHFWPTKLPITVDELDHMIIDILETNDLPNDSTYQHALAASIMHLGPVTNRKSKRFFSKSVHKQISNQVAFQKIEQLKLAEKKKQEAATLEKEVTPPAGKLDGSRLQVP